MYLGLVWVDCNEPLCNLLHIDGQLNKHSENAIFFPVDDLSSLIKDQVTIDVCVYFWDFNSVALIYLLVSLTITFRFYL